MFNSHVKSPLAARTGIPDLRGGLEFAGVNGRSRRQFPTDTNNWAPRFGFAFQPFKNTVLRGGYGVFFIPSLRAAGGNVGTIGFRSDTPWVGSIDGLTPNHYLRDPFPDGILATPGNAAGLLTGVGTSLVVTEFDHYVVPYSPNWSFNIQQQLPGSLLIEAGYVGSRGLHLSESDSGSDYNVNQLRPEQMALGTALQQRVRNRGQFIQPICAQGPLVAALIPASLAGRFILGNGPGHHLQLIAIVRATLSGEGSYA